MGWTYRNRHKTIFTAQFLKRCTVMLDLGTKAKRDIFQPLVESNINPFKQLEGITTFTLFSMLIIRGEREILP